LVLGRVRHRDAGTVSQLHGSTAPPPTTLRLSGQLAACLARQRRYHLKRQTLTRLAVRSGADALHTQAFRGALRRPRIDRSLTGAIGLQVLLHEHRQRDGRRIQPLAMLGQIRLRDLQQLRPRQHVEEIHRADLMYLSTDAVSMLLRLKAGITIDQGRPLGLVGWMCGNNILPIQADLPLLLQSLSLTHQ
jgi:hypothetical protein